MKGFVELSETESREVKGGALDIFGSLISGIISLVSNLFPSIKSLLGGLFGSLGA